MWAKIVIFARKTPLKRAASVVVDDFLDLVAGGERAGVVMPVHADSFQLAQRRLGICTGIELGLGSRGQRQTGKQEDGECLFLRGKT